MKKKIIKIITFVFGLTISASLIYAFNEYCAYKLSTEGIRYRFYEEAIHADFQQYIVPENIFDDFTNFKKTEPLQTNLSLDFSEKRPHHVKFGQDYRSIVRINETGEALYDVQFHFDSSKRRKVENQQTQKNDTALVLLGCSFTYGEGVNDFETFSSLISQKVKNANVYNLGIGGSSPNQIYFDMQNQLKDYYTNLHEKNIIIINTFFDAHLLRQSCDLRCYTERGWMFQKPKYVLNHQNELEFKGFLKDSYPQGHIFDFIFNLSIFKYYNFEISDIYGDRNISLTAKLLEAIRGEYQKKFNVLNFYNVFHYYSNDDIINNLSHKLVVQQMTPIIENKKIIKSKFYQMVTLPIDGHPNALGHQVLAKNIEWKLKQDYPKLFE